jgi:MYXO-CTERM domain-containing protein
VTFAVMEGGGSIAPAATSTGPDGTASAALVLGPAPGANRVRAEGVAAQVEFVARGDEEGAVPPPPAEDGCGCRAGGASRAQMGAVLLVLLALLGVWCQRRVVTSRS